MRYQAPWIATLLAACLGWAATPAAAQSSYPMVMSLTPLAVRIGETTENEVSARYNLYGAYQVFVSGTGVTGEVVPPEMPPADPNASEPPKKPEMPKIKVRFTAAADAVPGVRSFRLATPQGASTVGQLVVVRDPIVSEAGDNNTPGAAQAVSLPATLCGTIEQAEDVDYFKFTVADGSAWTFHVQSSRCQNQIHDLQTHSDPILTLRNAGGSVLAASDNYFFGDPLLHYRFAAAGEYFLEIRDVRYQGNADWKYAIEANDRPFVTQAHPMRLTPGVPARVELVGYNLPAEPAADVTLPAELADGLHWINLPLGDVAASAVPVVASRLPEPAEVEALAGAAEADATPTAPSAADGAAAADTAAAVFAGSAQAITLPIGISGRIGAEGDLDHFAFEAKQGERFSFEVVARRHQSALDPQLRIRNDQGAVLAENDDLSTGRHSSFDSLLENWTAPADGRYVVELGDAQQRGGRQFVYFLQATRSEPFFRLDLDTDKTLLSPGAGGAIFVRVYRKNGFAGEVQLAIEGLPPGVTASCGRIMADGSDGCIILQAAPDAPQGAANVQITGTATLAATDPNQPAVQLAATAFPMQEIYMPGGGRNHYPTEMHTVSVGDVMDVKSVKLGVSEITLKPGESQKIDVVIERREGFSGNVTLDCIYQHLGSIYGNSLPPGVTVDEKNSQTLLTGDQSQGHLVLTAAADAKPVERQQVAVMAHVSINFVMKYTYCGQPLAVTVAAP